MGLRDSEKNRKLRLMLTCEMKIGISLTRCGDKRYASRVEGKLQVSWYLTLPGEGEGQRRAQLQGQTNDIQRCFIQS